jgi:hypothetical protein
MNISWKSLSSMVIPAFVLILILSAALVFHPGNSWNEKEFPYVLRGSSGTISANLSPDTYDRVAAIPQPVLCSRYTDNFTPCTAEESRQYYLQYLDNPLQKDGLDDLVKAIRSKTADRDDQARIAISLVQHIHYDYSKSDPLFFPMGTTRFPYMVLYENSGVCEEKSLLLAYLLRELGYGAVLFEFSREKHMTVGISSPYYYSYRTSGYAFIETTTPTIPTYSDGDYLKIGKLTSDPRIIPISRGDLFNGIGEEFGDVRKMSGYSALPDEQNYSALIQIMKKYGMAS